MTKKINFISIGKIHTPYTDEAPYQPVENDNGSFFVVVLPKYEKALYKLNKFKYIFLIYTMDKLNKPYKNIISPPWLDNEKIGLFSSRSPNRPNPIGISIVKIKKIIKNKIYTTGLDVFNNTPLLDIKPYIKELDTKTDANYGWLDDIPDKEHLMMHIKGIPHNY